MTSKQTQPWIPLDKIDGFLQVEPALLILGLVIGAWLVSRFFLRHLSDDRRRTLQEQFRNLGFHLLIGCPLFLCYIALGRFTSHSVLLDRVATYLGLCALLSGAVIFVKVSRTLVFEYLFLRHMKVGFPVLLVNLFTLLLSISLGAWLGAEIFNIRLAPILATSAIFSLVLGLALQDTLGNLFAGVALQFDKPYEIGDWIEIQSTGQKWVGQVYEISWRATLLYAFTEESITVPNRVVAQAQIANFSTKYRPIIRSQILRFPFGSDALKIKDILSRVPLSIADIRKHPAPFVLISDTNESWVSFKLVYYIDDYGSQYLIADQIYSKALLQLEAAGLKLASHRITLTQESVTQEHEIPVL